MKFRGIDIQTNKWVYGNVLEPPSNKKFIRSYNDDGYIEYEIIPETLGMSSKLLDKNFNEIYHGDRLSLLNHENKKIFVTCYYGITIRSFSGGSNILQINGFYFKTQYNDFHTFPIVNNYCEKHDCEIMEIIGNIYENKPEDENRKYNINISV